MLGVEVTAELIYYYRDDLLKITPEDFVAYLRLGLDLRLRPPPRRAASMAEEAVRVGQQPW
jgi:hypothetical protein